MSPRLLLLSGPDGTLAGALRASLGSSLRVETLPAAPSSPTAEAEPVAGLVLDLRDDPAADAMTRLAAAGLSPRADLPLLLLLPARLAAARVDALLSLPRAEIFSGPLALRALTARLRSLAPVARTGTGGPADEARLFRGINRITEVLNRDLDLPETLRRGLREILAIYGCDRAYLAHIADPRAATLELPYIATVPDWPGPPDGATVPMDAFNQAVGAALASTGETLALGPDNAPPGYAEHRRAHGMQSMMVVNLNPAGGGQWVLGVHQCSHVRAWTAAEKLLFKEIALRVAQVLGNLLHHRGLRDSESRLRLILDSLPVMVWMGVDTRATWFNRRWLEFRGRSMEEEAGEGWIEGVHPDDRERCLRTYLDCFEGRLPYHLEYRLRRHDGEWRWMADQATPMLLPDGTCSGYIGALVDITGHRLLEEDMRRSRDNLRAILKGVRSAVMMMGPDAKVTFANDQAAVHMGFPSAEALMAADMAEFRDRFEILDEAGKPYPHEAFPNRVAFREARDAEAVLRFRLKPGGEERWSWVKASPVLDAAGRVVQVVQIVEDITGLRQAEEQLRQSQKMEAVGQLAGGIAHDFNNLLTAINGYSQLALAHQGSLDEVREYMQEVAAAGEKASALTRQLLSFSRKQIVSQRPLSLNESVAALGGMLARLIGEDIRFSTALDEAIPSVLGDKAQVDQVLLNLCLNARDAMPSGGSLHVETRTCDVSPKGWYGNLDIRPGRYVQLEVSDTGIGMSPVVRGRIFEPFFTTKPKDRGTGLGLSTVYSIVKQMGGFIHVTSAEGKGSSFRILLPGRGAGETEASAARPGREPEAPTAKGAVLLVEDDVRVQRLAIAVLRARGYTVHAFSEGESAVEWARASADPLDMLLSDVVLPGIGGAEVVSRIRELRPGLPVALMSGYTDDALVRKGVGDARIPFLQKPFVPSGLLAFVAGVLAAPAPAEPPGKGAKASARAGAA